MRTPPLLAEGIGLFGLSVSPSRDHHDQHVETTGEVPQQLYALTVDRGEMRPLGIDVPQMTSRVVSADGRYRHHRVLSERRRTEERGNGG